MQPERRNHARTGLSFTVLGLGTAPLANLYRAVPDAEADAIMEAAWEGGVRHFDTAPLYGHGLGETRLGRFLRGRPRDAYILATKVGRVLRAVPEGQGDGAGKWFDVPSRREIYDYSYDGVMRSFEDSLERMGADRVDILHAHDLDVRNHGGSQEALDARLREFVEGGHRALHDLRSQGVIRAIGLGVNEWEPALWLAERADLDVILLAGRWTLLEQGAAPLMEVCRQKGIGVIVGGPYNSGVLAGGEHYDYGGVPVAVAERARRLRAVCDRHGVPLIHAAFRFPLLHPAVVSVIPGSQTRAEMDSNLRAAEAEIPAALWEDLRAEGLLDGGP
ncbi:aldo/keto reductase [Rubellimicrobium sp. CFH 75288]|uniref:aldo/keto reductase n=1 Tax=Rubellimicrobium sp. CFH 75288 TaxID=2697034 RepID=UPI001411CF4D|nr:aldo/keto reductase [Rubellimicrobium sp. CFH 75288]NAZ35389.1 aldo/keto reductase [Rubellimicrobium sp. CFH 75288]